MEKKRAILPLLGWLLVTFCAAAWGAMFPAGEAYAALNKPAWNPPGWVFGPVWTVLYTLMAVAAWRVWRCGGFAVQRGPLMLYFIQLVLNAMWTPIFFGLHQPWLAAGEIFLLWLTIIATLFAFQRVDRLAGLLFVPYLLWVSFAMALNVAIARLNPG